MGTARSDKVAFSELVPNLIIPRINLDSRAESRRGRGSSHEGEARPRQDTSSSTAGRDKLCPWREGGDTRFYSQDPGSPMTLDGTWKWGKALAEGGHRSC